MSHDTPAGGYIEPKKIIPGWWIWAYWINPMAWAQQSLAINEFKCAACPLSMVVVRARAMSALPAQMASAYDVGQSYMKRSGGIRDGIVSVAAHAVL